MPTSYDSADMGEGQGLYEGPGRFKNVRFGYTDYGGKSQNKVLALLFDIEHLDAEGEVTVSSQIASVGKGWVPSDDGDTPNGQDEGPHIAASKEDQKFNKNSAAGLLLASIQKARGKALDKDKGASDLEGLTAEFERKPAPLPKNKDREVYIVTDVDVALPWEKGGKAKAKKKVEEEEEEEAPKAKAKSKAKPVEEEEAEEAPTVSKKKLDKVMAAVVKAAGKKGLTVGELPKAIYKTIAADFEDLMDERAAYADAASEDSYLEAENDNFAYDADSGKITPA